MSMLGGVAGSLLGSMGGGSGGGSSSGKGSSTTVANSGAIDFGNDYYAMPTPAAVNTGLAGLTSNPMLLIAGVAAVAILAVVLMRR